MGIREALGFDSARHDRAAGEYLSNQNPPSPTVGPLPASASRYGTNGAPVMGHNASGWSGWPVEDWDGPWLESGTDDWSGFGYGRHNPDGYQQRVSTVFTCIDRNSSQLASFPLYGVDGFSTEDLPSWARNPMPGMYSDWSDFALELANSMMLDGEAIVWASDRYADGYPAEFMCLPPRDVDIEYEDGRIVYMFNKEPLRRSDVCHIRYQKLAGKYRGIGPLQWAHRNLVSARLLEDYATNIAKHGPSAVLKHPASLSAQQRNDAKNNWAAAGWAMPGTPRVVSGGWELDYPTLSPKDMALLDLRVLDDQRICAAFRIQPYLVGVEQPGSMTYDNAAMIGDHHWRIGLRPLAKKIATAMSLWAIPGKRRMEFDRDEYVNPGFGDRAAAYSTMFNIENADGDHAMTIDEIRIRERLDPKQPDRLPGLEPVLVGDNP